MKLSFKAIDEDRPGKAWQAHAKSMWPGYYRWWLRDGDRARATYLMSRKAIRSHMPEIEPLWRELSEGLGGDDAQARFLSMWCPPPYITGCSQAVWLGRDAAHINDAALVRNYDFAPALFEGVLLATRWMGQRVCAMSDCLWGALDGMNESGLAVSLSFGGRKEIGQGFGIPLVLRYVLEVAKNVPEAVAILKRLPHHMSYSVTMLDKAGQWATVFVAPDRPTEVVDKRCVSNIQHAIEWPQHEAATRASLRAETLGTALAEAADVDEILERMLLPPMWQDAFAKGYGTLYTAVYSPAKGQLQLSWPKDDTWNVSLKEPVLGAQEISVNGLPENEADLNALTHADVFNLKW